MNNAAPWIIVVALTAGCTTAHQWRAAGSSIRLGYSETNRSNSFGGNDATGYQAIISYQPLLGFYVQRVVVENRAREPVDWSDWSAKLQQSVKHSGQQLRLAQLEAVKSDPTPVVVVTPETPDGDEKPWYYTKEGFAGMLVVAAGLVVETVRRLRKRRKGKDK